MQNKLKTHLDYLNKNTDDEIEKYIKTLAKSILSNIIKCLNTEYYENNISIVSDTVYDSLKEQLETIDPSNKLLTQIGSQIENRKKVPLPYHMGSMNKIKQTDVDKFEKWITENVTEEYVLTPKYDGISGLYVYEEGIDPKLYTRGNGSIGQDVSHFIPYLLIFEKIIRIKKIKKIAIRGEFIMTKKDFAEYSAKHEVSNSRNLIGGLINSKTIDKNILSYLQFVPYEIIEATYQNNKLEVNSEVQLNLLKEIIPTTTNYEIVKRERLNITTLSAVFTKWRTTFDYTIDGVIVSINDTYVRNTSGNPSYAFAYKQSYDEQQKVVLVKDVEWNVSKDGYLKPVILIPSTEINGVFIERVTGNNAKFITENRIGKGSKIRIVRSNDVIPKVEEVLISTEPRMPDIPYEWNDTHVDILATEQTEEQVIKEITYFFTTIDTVGVSIGVVTTLVQNSYDSIPKILALTVIDLQSLPSFKEKKSLAVYKGIHEALQKADLSTLMHASNTLGRTLGSKKIRLVLDEFKITNPEQLTELTSDNIKKIHGFEEKTATLFVDNIPKFLKFYKEIKQYLPALPALPALSAKPNINVVDFNGKSVVFTGFRSKELEEMVTSQGGNIKSSVSKNTHIVITTKENETSSKIVKAKELDVQIVFFDKEKFELFT